MWRTGTRATRGPPTRKAYDRHVASRPARQYSRRQGRGSGSVAISGDGGNRTHVRNRVRMASTSVAGALVSPLARLAGGVVRGQPHEMFPDRLRRTSPGEPAF